MLEPWCKQTRNRILQTSSASIRTKRHSKHKKIEEHIPFRKSGKFPFTDYSRCLQVAINAAAEEALLVLKIVPYSCQGAACGWFLPPGWRPSIWSRIRTFYFHSVLLYLVSLAFSAILLQNPTGHIYGVSYDGCHILCEISSLQSPSNWYFI